MGALRQLGATQQRLLRQLLKGAGQGTVEALCETLHITHNAVRQHLSALMAHGYVERAQSRPSGGRPVACYRLTDDGRALFPRNYGMISTALLTELQTRLGPAELETMLRDLGTRLGSNEVVPPASATLAEIATQLASQLDALGYEAIPARQGNHWEVEAFNCVFHAMARQHPQVCKFDIAFMEAASGRRIQHRECIIRGGTCCRFRIEPSASTPDK
ncbi:MULTISPECIES: helix-turn-helix transcriptional regulator [Dyella]|uniref:MarR family transcriptional regulator n=2 Tax=Dyella TaxID=231454 RepID=A0A4R0Z164_9GAMM|nr:MULTISPECIES: MarR family transcriptional regulator [Dyella]TBR39056.1 MarR family transcriptional regulator [Dyella terrae]TCI13354.1 MarR family transcriptional regulator [Dyella soli]